MLNTASVFDVLAADETERRTSSRRALALAHTRVDNHLGAFLRGAVTMDEFDARLAAIQDELTAYVATASEEMGHDHPEHIVAALIDHYAATRRWQPKESVDLVAAEGKQGAPLGRYPEPDPLDEHWDIDRPAFFDQGGLLATDPLRNEQGYIRRGIPKGIARDEGYEQIPYTVNPEDPRTKRDYGNDAGLEIAPDLPPVWPARGAPVRQGSNPSDQKDTSDAKVTCPECGGDGKTANAKECRKCHGSGRVDNFGDSVLDKVADAGNTGLGGPEPKIDKRKWTPQNLDSPDFGDKEHPTKEKDIIEPIKAVNDDELVEIGETRTEHQSLPSNSGDAGFSTKQVPSAPSSGGTWHGNGGQVDPVTS